MRDKHGRRIHYLRISVTDRCDLRCYYCKTVSEFHPVDHREILSYEETLRLVRIFHDLGFDTFRITGGEPLVRKGVPAFIEHLRAAVPNADIALTTNGVRFAEFAEILRTAGLDRVNFSLDSLRPKVFEEITGKDSLEKVLEGIDAAFHEKFSNVKVNMVVLRNTNEEDILPLVNRYHDRPITIRFIEFMPYGQNLWDPSKVVAHERIIGILKSEHLLRSVPAVGAGPSQDFEVVGARCRVGVISPLTRTFCEDCNRLRLTSTGGLKPCLFSSGSLNLKELLRMGATDSEIALRITEEVGSKPKNMAENKSFPAQIKGRSMQKIGG